MAVRNFNRPTCPGLLEQEVGKRSCFDMECPIPEGILE